MRYFINVALDGRMQMAKMRVSMSFVILFSFTKLICGCKYSWQNHFIVGLNSEMRWLLTFYPFSTVLVHGLPADCCPRVTDTTVQKEKILDYTIQSEGVCPVKAIR